MANTEFPARTAAPVSTDDELAAAIERGIADGSLIEVDDAFLARLAAL